MSSVEHTLPRTAPLPALPPRYSDARRIESDVPTLLHKMSGLRPVLLPLVLTACAASGVLLPATLTTGARLSLFVFALSVILWTTTKLEASYVALLALALIGVLYPGGQEMMFEALASDVVWLMISGFVLGAAIEATGLAGRMTDMIARRARTVGGVCWLLTTALIPLTLFLPSTSGTAATTLPLFRSLSRAADDRLITRALALLIPVVTLVATISTLVSAGSHLIANDLLRRATGAEISFARWALYGAPFGILAAYVSCWTIMRMFLTPELRRREIRFDARPRTRLSRPERATLLIAGAMIVLWLTESVHGLHAATVGVIGALALTAPRTGVVEWKTALKQVSWSLILFVGAALVAGRALIESGASAWMLDNIFALSGIASGGGSKLFAVAAVAVLTLTSHIYMTSHTARAAALTPALLSLAANLGLDATAVVFIGTVGMDYCLTFPVSSKALLVFTELDEETFRPADLMRLSGVLLVAHLALIVLFCFTYWRWVGLTL